MRSIPTGSFEASQEIGTRFTLAIKTAGLSLRAVLNPRSVHKVRAVIEQHGPAAVMVMLQGQLGPQNTVQSAGLSVSIKSQQA